MSVHAIPVTPENSIPRPRLRQKLDSAERLVNVRGLPGSGRTILVADWARDQQAAGTDVRWISASPDLADPHVLWGRLLVEDNPDTVGKSPRHRLEDELNRWPRPVVIVLDSARLYATERHLLGLAKIVQGTRSTRIVVIGHNLMPVAHLVRIAVITTAEMQATPAEIAAIAAAEKLQVPDDLLQGATRDYIGWLAATLAALRVYDAQGREGRDPELARAVAQEAALRIVTRMFASDYAVALLAPLWRWSFAETLSTSTAQLLWDIEYPHSAIARLENIGAVQPVPGTRPTEWQMGLSPLLHGALDEAMCTRFPGFPAEAERRLARWELARGNTATAVRHAVRSADWPLVTEIVGENWALLASADLETLRDAINALPAEQLSAQPYWQMARDYLNAQPADGQGMPARIPPPSGPGSDALISRLAAVTTTAAALRRAGRFAEAAEAARHAQRIVAAAEPAQLAPLAAFLPDLMVQWAQAQMLDGEGPGALGAFEAAYDAAVAVDNRRTAVETSGSIALHFALRGHLRQARIWIGRLPELEGPSNADTARVPGDLARALVAVAELQLDVADGILRTDLAAAPEGELWAVHAFVCALMGALRGDYVTHLVEIRDVIAAHPDAAPGAVANTSVLAAGQAELLIAAGRPAAAQELLDPLPSDAIGASGGMRASLISRVHLLAGDTGRAQTVAARQLARADTGPLATAEMLLVSATAALREGDTETAAEYFRHGVAVTRSHTALVEFARIPATELRALENLTGRPLPAETWRALEVTTAPRPDSGPPVPLTAREREVLELLLEGAGIDDIARARFVARNTVKTQLRSIYKKFGTTSREETIRVARELGRW